MIKVENKNKVKKIKIRNKLLKKKIYKKKIVVCEKGKANRFELIRL